MDIDDTARRFSREKIIAAHDAQQADEVAPVILAGVGLLEPRVGVGNVIGAAINKIRRQDVTERAINVAGGIGRQPVLGPVAVHHFIGRIHAAIGLWAVVGQVHIVHPHLHGARVGAAQAGFER